MTSRGAGFGTKVSIVGAGMAALRAAESLQASGFTGQISIFGSERHMPYNRPPLSKTALVDGLPSPADLIFRARVAEDRVTWRLGETIVSSDLDGHRLTTSTGQQIDYDVMIAATGVRARRLDCPGPQVGRGPLRSIADAQLVGRQLRRGSRLVVVGAGFIGCELAATAAGLGATVDVVAVDQFPLERPLGREVGAELQRRHESHGVTFHLGCGVRSFIGDSVVNAVELDDGAVIPSDIIVEAVGSRCNVEWLDGNGLDLTDGVLADGCLRIGEDAYAVGDVARYPNLLVDDLPRRIEHWQLATDTGRAVARTILSDLDGHPAQAFKHVPYFWSDQYDFKIQAYGWPAMADHSVILEGDLDGSCAIGYYAGTRLVAVVLIGLPKDALRYRAHLADALAGSRRRGQTSHMRTWINPPQPP